MIKVFYGCKFLRGFYDHVTVRAIHLLEKFNQTSTLTRSGGRRASGTDPSVTSDLKLCRGRSEEPDSGTSSLDAAPEGNRIGGMNTASRHPASFSWS